MDIHYFQLHGPIVAAALKQGDKIYFGKTHSDCFIQEPKGVLRSAEQGFLTASKVFVDRKVALEIAKHFNQIKTKHLPEDELLSEDLYY